MLKEKNIKFVVKQNGEKNCGVLYHWRCSGIC